MKKNEFIWLGVGVLGLFLVVFLVARSTKTNQPADQQSNKPSASNTPATNQPSATTTRATAKPAVTKPSVSTGQTAMPSYIQALSTYQKSGYYIQFFPCQASPGSLIVKRGSKVMLDNRDNKTHVIGIRSVRYSIGSYNFAIATVDSLGTNYVTCDGGGSAQITVVP